MSANIDRVTVWHKTFPAVEDIMLETTETILYGNDGGWTITEKSAEKLEVWTISLEQFQAMIGHYNGLRAKAQTDKGLH